MDERRLCGKRVPNGLGCNQVLLSKKQLRKLDKNGEIDEVYLIEFKRDVDLFALVEKNDDMLLKESIADVRLKDIVKSNPDVYALEPKITGMPKEKEELSHPTMMINTGDAKPVKKEQVSLDSQR
jgi:hypothetical protein